MEVIDSLALSLGAAWASGINLYAALFMLGFMHAGGYMVLPPSSPACSSAADWPLAPTPSRPAGGC